MNSHKSMPPWRDSDSMNTHCHFKIAVPFKLKVGERSQYSMNILALLPTRITVRESTKFLLDAGNFFGGTS